MEAGRGTHRTVSESSSPSFSEWRRSALETTCVIAGRDVGDQDVGAALHDTDGLVPLADVVRAGDLAPVGRRDAGIPGAGEARGGTGRAVVTIVV
eukprot:5852825-Prymnesium_polylepis.1